MRIATWNIQWRRRTSEAGAEILRRISALEADVVCLTEAHVDFLRGGHQLAGEPDWGYPLREGRRKVVLWSRRPWRDARMELFGAPSGRFVAATTVTPQGEALVAGICAPWRDAHVSSGRRDRRRWEDHEAFLAALGRAFDQRERLILLGDFNQTVERRAQPRRAHAALSAALSGLAIASASLHHDGCASIDHIAHGPVFRFDRCEAIPNRRADGSQLSDHFGVVAIAA